jgi:hypothetical protein
LFVSYLILLSLVVGKKDTAPSDVFKVTFPDYEKYLPFLYAKENKEMEQH